MFHSSNLETLFAVFALAFQTALVLHFTALRYRPQWQQRWGWLVYALSLPGLALGFLFWTNDLPWYFWLPTLLFAAWAALGSTVDIIRPVNWRSPPRCTVFLPYVALYTATQLTFWIPLWFIWIGYWVAYAVLFSLSTVLNLRGHFGRSETRAGRPA